MITRRKLLVAAAAAGGLGTMPAWAQPTRKIRVIGTLALSGGPGERERSLVEGLRELGWVEGRNLRIESRFSGNDASRLLPLAEELVRLNVDLIVAWATPVAIAARKATSSIPIVFTSADPVGSGIVTSLARPGGNATGTSSMLPELAGKRLELLRELLPRMSKVAFLGAAHDPAHRIFLRELESAGKASRVAILPVIVNGADDLPAAFDTMSREKADAVVVQPLFSNTMYLGEKVAELAIARKLPSISDGAGFAESGGLLFYGPDPGPLFRRLASYVDRILKGAKPGELPIEQPQHFQMLVNTQTAARLGIKLPRSLMLRADRVIE